MKNDQFKTENCLKEKFSNFVENAIFKVKDRFEETKSKFSTKQSNEQSPTKKEKPELKILELDQIQTTFVDEIPQTPHEKNIEFKKTASNFFKVEQNLAPTTKKED